MFVYGTIDLPTKMPKCEPTTGEPPTGYVLLQDPMIVRPGPAYTFSFLPPTSR